MKLKEFNSIDDLRRNFNNVYVKIDGVVHWVATDENQKGKPVLKAFPLDENGEAVAGKMKEIDPTLKAFQHLRIENPPLGWIARGNGHHYLVRNTRRQFKFGISAGTVDYWTFNNGELVYGGQWANVDRTISKWFVRKPTVYNGDGVRNLWITPEIAIISGKLFRGIHHIGTLEGKAFRLLPDWDDSISRLDLNKLEIPLHV